MSVQIIATIVLFAAVPNQTHHERRQCWLINSISAYLWIYRILFQKIGTRQKKKNSHLKWPYNLVRRHKGIIPVWFGLMIQLPVNLWISMPGAQSKDFRVNRVMKNHHKHHRNETIMQMVQEKDVLTSISWKRFPIVIHKLKFWSHRKPELLVSYQSMTIQDK